MVIAAVVSTELEAAARTGQEAAAHIEQEVAANRAEAERQLTCKVEAAAHIDLEVMVSRAQAAETQLTSQGRAATLAEQEEAAITELEGMHHMEGKSRAVSKAKNFLVY